MVLSSLFNTLHCDLLCPFCQENIVSGIGFKVGSLNKILYKLGDTINWDQQPTRPAKRPAHGNIISLGHFNCDNTKCPTWQDCYPDIQTAKITIKKDKIVDVAVYTDPVPQEQFAILNETVK
jgi:hypothetical protein